MNAAVLGKKGKESTFMTMMNRLSLVMVTQTTAKCIMVFLTL